MRTSFPTDNNMDGTCSLAETTMARALLTSSDPTSPFFMPDRDYILDLKVGDLAPSCMGYLPITDISIRRNDIDGFLFICYYVATGPSSTVSSSLKDATLVRRPQLDMTSADVDRIEAAIIRERRANGEISPERALKAIRRRFPYATE